MAQYLPAFVPAVIFSRKTISFAAAGLNGANTSILRKVGAYTISWVPGSPINSLVGLEYNTGYIIEPIADIYLDDSIFQTKICEETGYTPPPVNTGMPPAPFGRTTTGVDDALNGGATFAYFPELVGIPRLITFSRDGITQTVVYTSAPNEKQVRFDSASGHIIPPETNPFGREDLLGIYIPLTNVQTIPIDAPMTGVDDTVNGGATFAYFPELVGIETILSFSRDGVTQTVVYNTAPAGMQVNFVKSEGRFYPPASNPFSAEDLHITYKKTYL